MKHEPRREQPKTESLTFPEGCISEATAGGRAFFLHSSPLGGWKGPQKTLPRWHTGTPLLGTRSCGPQDSFTFVFTSPPGPAEARRRPARALVPNVGGKEIHTKELSGLFRGCARQPRKETGLRDVDFLKSSRSEGKRCRFSSIFPLLSMGRWNGKMPLGAERGGLGVRGQLEEAW